MGDNHKRLGGAIPRRVMKPNLPCDTDILPSNVKPNTEVSGLCELVTLSMLVLRRAYVRLYFVRLIVFRQTESFSDISCR